VFREAVRKQSDVDVDFGLFLSGGVDSSLISAVTRSLHPERPLKAYTLRFKVSRSMKAILPKAWRLR